VERDYDFLVLGSGPAGQKAAIQAAKLGRRVAVVERRGMVGGVCVNTGTIPSKTLREAVVYLTGMMQRGLYGQSYRVKDDITADDLLWRTQQVMQAEIEVVRDQLARNDVRVLIGSGRFRDPHTIIVRGEDGEERTATADTIVIATGTVPARPDTVDFDGATILDSDGILQLQRLPRSLVVVGAGVIGIEYASIFAALGAKVTVIEKRAGRLLDFCDGELVEALQYYLRRLGVTFRVGEAVTSVEHVDGATVTRLASGKTVVADVVLYSAGRQGATSTLDLAAAGLQADARGRLAVDREYRMSAPHIFAVGDVIGFPSLAATSMEQGRRAACAALGIPVPDMGELMPIGIYTVPELSFVGRTEETLTAENVAYEVGISRYRELARGQILGDQDGLLKLLVAPRDRCLLGVHAFGTSATELVHVGQALMGCGGTVDYLVNTVFNYPTLAESYKVAALDASNKLHTLSRYVT
jgi:NAD(P) transhydrogenase